MKRSVKNFLLESESEKDENFSYIKGDVIAKVNDVDFNSEEDYVKIDFSTTYKKNFSFVTKLSNFKKWLNGYLKGQEKPANLFRDYLINYFDNSSEAQQKKLDEIIDDTN